MNIKKSFLALLLSAMCLVTGCASQSQTSDSSSNEVTSIVIETSVETTVEEKKELLGEKWKRITAINKLNNIVKVRVNHIGQIVAVGEY